MTGAKLQVSKNNDQEDYNLIGPPHANTQTIGQPQITHFKTVYKKKTNFSIDRQQISLTSKETKFGREYKPIITKNSDLLHKLYLEVELSCKTKTGGVPSYTVNHFMNSLVKEYRIESGPNILEEGISQWKQIRTEFMNKSNRPQVVSSSKGGGNQIDLNFTSDLNRTEYTMNEIENGTTPIIVGGNYNDIDIDATTTIKKKYIYEFDFWFTRNIGNSLPLLNLQDDLTLIFKLEKKENLIGDIINIDESTFDISKLELYGDFICLDTQESQLYKKEQEFLIETLQWNNFTTPSRDGTSNTTQPITIDISYFSRPTKCLIWCIVNPGAVKHNKGQGPCYFTSLTNTSLYGSDGTDGSIKLNLSDQIRVNETPMIYFTRKYPKLYCNNIPPLDRIGIYSFATNPFELEPSGHCNFTNYTTIRTEMKFANNNIDLIVDKGGDNEGLFMFAINYNILSISSEGYIDIKYKHKYNSQKKSFNQFIQVNKVSADPNPTYNPNIPTTTRYKYSNQDSNSQYTTMPNRPNISRTTYNPNI